MQSTTILAFIGALFFYSAYGQTMPPTTTTTSKPTACSERPEGWIVEIGCWGFKQCIEGVENTYLCDPGLNYDRESGQCVAPGQGNTACGEATLCDGREDGNHPDVLYGCSSFFTCYNGIYYGRQYCPHKLLFNSEVQICDHPHNVGAPCNNTQ